MASVMLLAHLLTNISDSWSWPGLQKGLGEITSALSSLSSVVSEGSQGIVLSSLLYLINYFSAIEMS